ncbi:hypothetical protein Phum_PHUM173550 [Pediculus humanus corporis]|uniref:Uncharacterized protein n=1 Tax=Pediculus humanus subsp. corporis TaxID=121224 RepID=E0VG52_PEDHC|nr:uncharacterized protein Phum_PHUM173550 [Pediculus humanus corporis]EEB12358.1 hypothetical protein Phum_PHUM173550 [Pediculus humanus corporis]
MDIKQTSLEKTNQNMDNDVNNVSNSEDDESFEEALTDPFFDNIIQNNNKSNHCFGDLKKDLNKKNAGTLTTEFDMETSWIAKLAEDIKLKVFQM